MGKFSPCRILPGAGRGTPWHWRPVLYVGLLCLTLPAWGGRGEDLNGIPADNEHRRILDMPQEKMPGQLVNVSGRLMHIYCRGQWDGPTIILEAGLGGFALNWVYVQEKLASTMRVCSYDRAGYAWSEPSFSPRLGSQLAMELLELLESSAVEPPYTLVGHSFGGYVVRNFAALVPGQVAGMVLVESSHPEQHARLPDVHVRKQQPVMRARTRLVSVFDPQKIRIFLEKYPAHMRATLSMFLASHRALNTLHRESSMFPVSAQEVLQVPLPTDLPLVVVSRGRQEWEETPLGRAREQAWQQMQAELAQLSRRSVHIIAGLSGHQVHLDEPEVVVDAICQVLALAGWPLPETNERLGRVGCVNDSGAVLSQDQ